ncbi:MAG TPA: translation initiation factor IF-2 [bacterium]|nr:translation initiation factor IF-2 [bacterium]
MARKRVYQVAREFNLSSEALLEMLRGMGLAVKSHMSAIDDENVTALREKLRQEKEEVKKDEARKKAIVAKPPVKEKAPEKAPEPAKRVGLRRKVNEKSVKETVRKTLAEIEGKKTRRRKRKLAQEEGLPEEEAKVIKVTEFISVGELASVLGVKSADVVACCMRMGVMATINQRLDADTIEAIADEFDYDVEFVKEYGAELAEEEEAAEAPRDPVVTIMGHVDHGKTSFLDYVRRSNVVAGESGGITQHIGAYEVETAGGRITFLDTPGHEAFTAMRARGAQATDIVVLVVAANERVMPQTIEAIDHAKAADVPIIVAINKIDLPDSNVDRIKQELAGNGLTPDDWGGNVPMVPVSAKTGEGIQHLLEMILLQAAMLDLKAPRDGRAGGVVIESRVEQGRGIVITILSQKGTLRLGDPFVAGIWAGKVRAMFNERRKNVDIVLPAMPVEILGSQGVPQAGDSFMVTRDDREARDIATRRQVLQREKDLRKIVHVSLQDLYARIQAGEIKELRVVTKGDVDGSVEALSDALQKLGSDKVTIKTIHKGVGPVNESDVLLAAASDAIVIGFHVGVLPKAREIAKREQVDVRTYDIIYEVTKDIQAAMEGLLGPVMGERITGSAEVRKVFTIKRVGAVAGTYVTEGVLNRNCLVRVLRAGQVVFEGKLSSLKRFKDDAKQVSQGYECGAGVEGFSDLQEGDILQAYVLEEVKRA